VVQIKQYDTPILSDVSGERTLFAACSKIGVALHVGTEAFLSRTAAENLAENT
jgi:hypothetical protein